MKKMMISVALLLSTTGMYGVTYATKPVNQPNLAGGFGQPVQPVALSPELQAYLAQQRGATAVTKPYNPAQNQQQIIKINPVK